MMLSLWNAPLPWVNVHGSLAALPKGSEALSRHLAVFHADANSIEGTAPKWHVHFVLPWSLSDEGPCPADGRHHDSHELSVSPAPAGRATDSDLLVDGGAIVPPVGAAAEFAHRPMETLADLRAAGPQTGHFLQSGSVSLRTLICVATC